MRYLVTGCAGFIASQVCEQLLAQSHEVYGIDNLNDYYSVKIKNYRLDKLIANPKFKFSKIDIENKKSIFDLLGNEHFDAIFNLAARAGVRYSMEFPEIYLSTNTLGTLNLLDLCRKIGTKKFILASTSSLYAGCPMPFNEELPVNTPISPYAATKKAAEALCHSYHYLYGIDVSIVRYFTVYGPAGRPDMSIYRFIKWIDEGKEIELFGDGLQSRDFTYVTDIARGTILAAKNVGYEIINLGGGKNPIDLLTVIKEIEMNLNKKAKIRNEVFHKADIKETWADIEKASRLLNWKPQIGLKDGIRSTVNWWKEAPQELKAEPI
jgi:UDP-glucuronate 4-epimerase